MQVAQYLFQSPSSSPVQVGKLDTSSSQNQGSVDTNAQAVASSKTQPQAKEVAQVQTQKTQSAVDTTSVEPTRLLNVVA
jgi:hypothetical protein